MRAARLGERWHAFRYWRMQGRYLPRRVRAKRACEFAALAPVMRFNESGEWEPYEPDNVDDLRAKTCAECGRAFWPDFLHLDCGES